MRVLQGGPASKQVAAVRAPRVRTWTIQEFVNHLQPGFAFARYGDGAFLCLQGVKGHNCDGVVYTAAQAQAMHATLLDQQIVHGLGDMALSHADAATWLAEHQLDIDWWDCNVMHVASETGKLAPFTRWLHTRRVALVGAAHLACLGEQGNSFFPIPVFIACHPTRAFEQVEKLEQALAAQLDTHRIDTVLLSAGTFASPVLVSRLHARYPQLTVIDTGSVWDPYAGVYSRKVHRRRGPDTYRALRKVNFPQEQ